MGICPGRVDVRSALCRSRVFKRADAPSDIRASEFYCSERPRFFVAQQRGVLTEQYLRGKSAAMTADDLDKSHPWCEVPEKAA
jgi:hypothetical protein